MKAYKGFNKDMTCRGFQFKEGETYIEDKAELCRNGFHACERPLDIFAYYSPAESVYHEVELDDGRPNTVTRRSVNPSIFQIFIDVGINRDEDGRLCGDVSQDARELIDSMRHICTPVPGGVGKWTVRELVLRLKEMEGVTDGI